MTVTLVAGKNRHVGNTTPEVGVACRLCETGELLSFLDLEAMPPCELFLTAAAAEAPEARSRCTFGCATGACWPSSRR